MGINKQTPPVSNTVNTMLYFILIYLPNNNDEFYPQTLWIDENIYDVKIKKWIELNAPCMQVNNPYEVELSYRIYYLQWLFKMQLSYHKDCCVCEWLDSD